MISCHDDVIFGWDGMGWCDDEMWWDVVGWDGIMSCDVMM